MTNEIKSYLICATPRSGSSLLCEALRNTGLAGNPDEYFGPMHVERWNERWQTHSEIEYLEKAISYSKGATNVISMKIMRVYWRNFLGYLYLAKGSAGLTEFEIL
jgi:trehalose 2-sulfotransferase